MARKRDSHLAVGSPGRKPVFQGDGGSLGSERDFRTFFELSDVGNVITDSETYHFLKVNQKFCEMTGYSAKELRALTSGDITHPEDRGRDQEGWAECLEKGSSHFHIEKRYLRKNGSVIWVSVTSTIVRGDDGKPLHAIGVVRDITERQQAVAELERTKVELEKRIMARTADLVATNKTLATLIDASPLAIVVMDSRKRIALWNPAAEALLGWGGKDAVGKSLPELSQDSGLLQLDEILAVDGTIHQDAYFRFRDGSRRDVGIWSRPLLGEGHLLLMMDITEKKFLERALLEAAEREQRRIGQDLHDHLCQHLLGAAFATKALAGELDKEGSKVSPQLHDLARLISDAVSQVRDISRGLHPVELDSAGLMSALQELANRVSQMVPCKFVCEKNVLVSDANSALQAYRIAQEAVANALQQTGAQKITIKLAENNRSVCLEVSDDGIREGELTADQSGLSAKIMHYRMNAIGGELSIRHPKGKGTRVSCSFPRSS